MQLLPRDMCDEWETKVKFGIFVLTEFTWFATTSLNEHELSKVLLSKVYCPKYIVLQYQISLHILYSIIFILYLCTFELCKSRLTISNLSC